MYSQFSVSYTTVNITHPPGEVFQARLLDNQEDANTEPYVFGTLSAKCFLRRPFWHRHYSNRGDINHGKSALGCVIYAVDIHRRIRWRRYICCLPPVVFIYLVWAFVIPYRSREVRGVWNGLRFSVHGSARPARPAVCRNSIHICIKHRSLH